MVILGALFKLTHIPGANAMLFIGMGTEVLVFFISGFDRPAELKRDEDRMSLASDEEDWDEEAVGERKPGTFLRLCKVEWPNRLCPVEGYPSP